MPGIEYPLTLLANGVQDKRGRFFQFKVNTFTVAATTMVPVPPYSSRIYVKSASLTIRLAAADTTTAVQLYGTTQGYGTSLAKINTIPSVEGAYYHDFQVNVLLDPGKSPAIVIAGGDPTTVNCVMVWAEVPNDV